MDNPEHSLFFVVHADEKTAVFSEEERHHALSVLRTEPFSCIHATDGKGNIYTCFLRDRATDAEVTDVRMQPAPVPRIHVFIGIPERDAFEETVKNLSALGIAKITPMVCIHCQKKWWAAWETHRQRCHKKMIAGIKQSLVAWLPELTEPMEFRESLEMVRSCNPKQCFVADPDGTVLRLAVDGLTDSTNATCFIGPPGGFSQNEKNELKNLGFVFVKIANTRLRTELAAVVLCAQLISKSIVA